MISNLFPNYAGRSDVDDKITIELETAGIKIVRMPEFWRNDHEVKTVISGELYQWRFDRAWYYWVAKGPGIPSDIAEELHKEFGKVIRVAGHCSCPSPLEWYNGFAVGFYHVDTQNGLNALANTIKEIYRE